MKATASLQLLDAFLPGGVYVQALLAAVSSHFTVAAWAWREP